MSDKSGIEWTDATWNPVTGCTKVSAGCDRCYAETFAERWRGTPGHHFENGFDVTLRPDKLDLPLRWRKPRKVFVNSMSDLFHDQIPNEYIARVFAVMAWTPQHTYQILTKRHARMRSLLGSEEFQASVRWFHDVRDDMPTTRYPAGDLDAPAPGDPTLPLRNVWLGVSVENQQWADIRIPALLDTPAAVRFLSCEPLLGPIDLWLSRKEVPASEQEAMRAIYPDGLPAGSLNAQIAAEQDRRRDGLHWVIVGGESGHGARPMHPQWARSLRDQCQAAGVPFLFKQWGEWGPAPWRIDRATGESVEDYKARSERVCATHAYAVWADQYGHDLYKPSHRPWSVERDIALDETSQAAMRRHGKHAAGRELDSRTWDEYPEVRP